MKWTTWGPIRGGCGHAHSSAMAAIRCLESDREVSDGCSERYLTKFKAFRAERTGGVVVTTMDYLQDDDGSPERVPFECEHLARATLQTSAKQWICRECVVFLETHAPDYL